MTTRRGGWARNVLTAKAAEYLKHTRSVVRRFGDDPGPERLLELMLAYAVASKYFTSPSFEKAAPGMDCYGNQLYLLAEVEKDLFAVDAYIKLLEYEPNSRDTPSPMLIHLIDPTTGVPDLERVKKLREYLRALIKAVHRCWGKRCMHRVIRLSYPLNSTVCLGLYCAGGLLLYGRHRCGNQFQG